MSSIDRSLLPDEQILFRTKKHLIVFFFPVVWVIFSIYATVYMRANPILASINWMEWVPWLLAIVFWGYVGLNYITSEFVVTNKRIIMREGFFNRHINDLRLSTISRVNVDQSLFGQIMNYGVVSIYAFGAFDAFTLIARPFMFQQSVNEQLDQLINK